MELIKGNCLEKLKDIPDKSVDLAYMDLCYGQTACKWDKKFTKEEWVIFWKELKRVARNDRTPFFFSCTTKFGFDIIESNKKWFRWDLVWKKNRAAGFLNAYKIPMRKHEMIYCFSDKCPEYDVSSHLTGNTTKEKSSKGDIWIKSALGHREGRDKPHISKEVKIPLPTSDITPPTEEHELVYCFSDKCPEYDISSHKEEGWRDSKYTIHKERINNHYGLNEKKLNEGKSITKRYKVPLPTSDITPPTEEHELVYCFSDKCPEYDVSSHSEYVEDKRTATYKGGKVYGIKNSEKPHRGKQYKVPLPTSDITPPTKEHELVYCFSDKCPEYDVSSHSEYKEDKECSHHIEINGLDKTNKSKSKRHIVRLPSSDITPPTEEHELVYCFSDKCPEYDVSSHSEYKEDKNRPKRICNDIYGKVPNVNRKMYNVPLPTSDITPPTEEPSSWCEFKSDERTGHRTAKPVALMEFLLKYWSKEGGTVLDPTMGSGSMGIACKKMNRKFIGIELNDDIYELAKKRIGV